MANVVFKNVSASGTPHSIADFSLTIEDRSFVVVTDSAPALPSLLVRSIAGLAALGSGEIFVGDRPVGNLSPAAREVALVSRTPALYPHLKVSEQIGLGLAELRLSKTEIEKRVKDAAEVLSLVDLLRTSVSKLSSSEKVRTAVAQAVARQPKVFLFDDAFADLDANSRAIVAQLHHRLNVTTVYATADSKEAMLFGTQVAVLNAGKLEQFDTPFQVYQKPANQFVAGFFGRPAMNLLQGSLRSTPQGLVFKEDNQGTIELKLSADRVGSLTEGAVILGLRPEDCVVYPLGENVPGASRALVDLVEPQGGETYFHLQTGAHSLIGRGDGFADPSAGGHRIQFKVNGEKAHFFDPSTSRRIG